jgi:hypothetical protein
VSLPNRAPRVPVGHLLEVHEMITAHPADFRSPGSQREPSEPTTDWPRSVMRWVPLLVPIAGAVLIGFMFAVASVA